jgi:hypothetical protein
LGRYNLREIIDHIDELRFASRAEKHELSHLYEAKIKNMGNAGRNGGEYYTPRPLIRAIITVVNPKIGETICDPAVGSAGFPCEAFEYLSRCELTLGTRSDSGGRGICRRVTESDDMAAAPAPNNSPPPPIESNRRSELPAPSSHLINPSLLRADKFLEFMEDRQKRMLQLIEKATGKVAYTGDPPEEGEGVEGDEDTVEAELTSTGG